MGWARRMNVARSGSRRGRRRLLRKDQRIPQAPFRDARRYHGGAHRRGRVEKRDDRAGMAGFAHAASVRSLVVLSRRADCRIRARRPFLDVDMQDARHRKRHHASQPHKTCALLTKTCKLMERATRHGRIHAASCGRYTITLRRLRRSVRAPVRARDDDNQRMPYPDRVLSRFFL